MSMRREMWASKKIVDLPKKGEPTTQGEKAPVWKKSLAFRIGKCGREVRHVLFMQLPSFQHNNYFRFLYNFITLFV